MRTASRVYRELTGLADDVCYGLYCSSLLYGDYVSVDLLDVELEWLGSVDLLAQTGEIVSVSF